MTKPNEMSRSQFLAGFHETGFNARHFEEIVPSEDWALLPQACTAWTSLTDGQRRALVVLFDVYAERIFDPASDVPVRTLSETGWRRVVRDLLVEGPKRRPLLPLHVMYSLHAAAAVARPGSCPMPAWTPLERSAARRPPSHCDFVAFVSLLSAVAMTWRDERSNVLLLGRGSVEQTTTTAALPDMLHTVALSNNDAAEAEARLTSRQIHRVTPRSGPKLKLWELLLNPTIEDSEAVTATGDRAQECTASVRLAASTKRRTSSGTLASQTTRAQQNIPKSIANRPYEPFDASEVPQRPHVISAAATAATAAVAANQARRDDIPRTPTSNAAASPTYSQPRSAPSPSASHQASQLRRLNAKLDESRSQLSGLREELLTDLRAEVRAVVRAELAVTSASMRNAFIGADDHVTLTNVKPDVSSDGAIDSASKPPYAILHGIQSVASDATPKTVTAPLDLLSENRFSRGPGRMHPRELRYTLPEAHLNLASSKAKGQADQSR